jgi:hypothetical protein
MRTSIGLWLLFLAKKTLKLPQIICLCGSTRFYDEFQRANLLFTLKGYIVLSIGCDTKSDQDIAEISNIGEVKVKLDSLHMWKVLLADTVHILNKHGYIGESTRNEIEHARRYHKDITYLETVVW